MKIVCLFLVLWLTFVGYSFGAGGCEGEWDPSSAGPVTTWTAPLCAKGELVVQPYFFYVRTRGAFDAEGNSDSLPDGDKKWQRQYQIFSYYGITDRLEVDAQAAYQENYVREDGSSASEDGFGDSFLFLRYCAIEEKGWIPHITGLAQLKLPTGKYQKLDENKLGTDLMGGGAYEHAYGIILTKKYRPFIFHADTIYGFPVKCKVDSVKTLYGQYLNYDFGFEWILSKGLNLLLEFNGFMQGDTKEDGAMAPSTDTSSFAISPGIGWSTEKIQTVMVYQRILTGTNADANDSVIFSLVYTF